MPEIPKPIDGKDYYLDELRTHTVTIDVTVGGLKEQDSEAEICLRAVAGLRDGSLDGDATIVWSERVRDVELDFETELPFDRAAWMKAKLMELGLNEMGEPLRPGEKVRPECEMTLTDFRQERYSFAWIATRVNIWLRRCRWALRGAV